MRHDVRTFLFGLLFAVALATGFIWYDNHNSPSMNVQSGDCIDSSYKVVDCDSPDAAYLVHGDAYGADPQNPCRAYPTTTNVVGFTNGAGAFKQVCVTAR